jgi:hypothetical protein
VTDDGARELLGLRLLVVAGATQGLEAVYVVGAALAEGLRVVDLEALELVAAAFADAVLAVEDLQARLGGEPDDGSPAAR